MFQRSPEYHLKLRCVAEQGTPNRRVEPGSRNCVGLFRFRKSMQVARSSPARTDSSGFASNGFSATPSRNQNHNTMHLIRDTTHISAKLRTCTSVKLRGELANLRRTMNSTRPSNLPKLHRSFCPTLIRNARFSRKDIELQPLSGSRKPLRPSGLRAYASTNYVCF